MSIVTSQQLAHYYDQYKTTEVTFNKQVTQATGLLVNRMYLKVQAQDLPCTVFSSSMAGAKVIANVRASAFLVLRRQNSRVALHWCFKQPDKTEPISFFTQCHASGFTHFNVQKPGVQMLTLEYTQRPPDDLVEILGSLLEASANSQQRREERVVINPETMKKLGMETRDASLLVDGAPRRCILRDLSFIGAEVLASGLTEKDAGKKVSLTLAKGEQAAEMSLPGTITRVEAAGGRKDIQAVAIEYSADTPMGYKLLINSFLTSLRKPHKDTEENAAQGSKRVQNPQSSEGSDAPADQKPADEEKDHPDG